MKRTSSQQHGLRSESDPSPIPWNFSCYIPSWSRLYTGDWSPVHAYTDCVLTNVRGAVRCEPNSFFPITSIKPTSTARQFARAPSRLFLPMRASGPIGASARKRARAEIDIVDALPALRAIGLFDVFEIRDVSLRECVDAY
jgi:hypothetical protein